MKNLIAILLANLLLVENVYARAGGGGSSSGGSGGSGGSGSGVGGLGGLVWLAIIVGFFIYVAYKRKQKIKMTAQEIEKAQAMDGAWQMDEIKKRVSDVFLDFQRDWSSFNVESMKGYLSDAYYQRMVLEMNVLKNQDRRNEVGDPEIKSIEILEASDHADNSKDYFVAEIKASANDVLWDTKENIQLFADGRTFVEYWKFVRTGKEWKLDIINQETEAGEFKEKKIIDFAQKNGFFYDADFGWLMMPNKGVIFQRSNFQSSDINNHVVGYFREKIVEFYTFIPHPKQKQGVTKIGISYTGTGVSFGGDTNYVVAQTILPIEYRDILVRRRRRWFNFSPRGLRRIHTESNEFERKFCLWADPADQINSFELLTPNFMAKVYDLPFELNIEIVGKFIYFYAKSRKDVDYDKMLEILSWAFDEMKS